MKKVAALSALLLLQPFLVYAQSNWQKKTVSGVDAADTIGSIVAAGSLALGSVSGNPINHSVRSLDSGNFFSAETTIPALKLKALSFSFLYGLRGDSIMRTTDQGINWLVVEPDLRTMRPADVHFTNTTNAWAVGDSPFVAVTSDNWVTNPPTLRRFPFPNDSVSMTSVQFLDNNFGFVAGKSTQVGSKVTVILRTTNGGMNWQDRSLPDTCDFAPVTIVADFINTDTGWAVQTCGVSSATIFKTTNGGANWTPQDTIALFQFSDIDAVNAQNVWIVGTDGIRGRVFRTSDGGNNWAQEVIPGSPGKLFSVNMLNASHGYACGTNGTLLVYSPSGTDIPRGGANRPKTFELFQNYPNPFNAGTKISFTLLKRQPVTLTIYNILGQPVKTLLNREMPAGKNEISWDGTFENGLVATSGLYFYELKTLAERQIRKMVFLK